LRRRRRLGMCLGRALLTQRARRSRAPAMTALLAKMPTVHQNAVSYSCASASPVSAWRPMIRAAAARAPARCRR